MLLGCGRRVFETNRIRGVRVFGEGFDATPRPFEEVVDDSPSLPEAHPDHPGPFEKARWALQAFERLEQLTL